MPVADRHLILYSANTWLAFAIAAQYYRDVHYVWCTPYFNGASSLGLAPGANPPSSTPANICRGLAADIAASDAHSAHIAQNRAGILRGARAKRKAKIISAQEEADIVKIVGIATLQEFRPVAFVIPTAEVRPIVRDPPVEDKAHPMSEEFIIDELPRSKFDVIMVP